MLISRYRNRVEEQTRKPAPEQTEELKKASAKDVKKGYRKKDTK